MPIIADGVFTESKVVLQTHSTLPPVTLHHSRFDGENVRIELNGLAHVDARTLINAILTLVPDAQDRRLRRS